MSISSNSAFADARRLPSSGPLVDVGMPAYRRPHFIGEAIESVLAQTYATWRLVVSENGPGGGEVEAVVRRYTSDARVRYVATGRNLGPAANWNRLLQAGTASYFTLIQDDDKWDPEFLARRVAFLEANPSCGFVFAGERKIDQHGRHIVADGPRAVPGRDVSDVLPEGIYSPREFIQTLYRYKLGGMETPTICSLGVMSRRSALEAVGAEFRENQKWHDDETCLLGLDWELYLRMALRFPTGFMAVKDASQRIHHPSITSEVKRDGEHLIRYHQYLGEWFRRELSGFQLPRQYDELFAYAYIMAALDALERGDRRKCARYLRSSVRRCPSSIVNPRLAATAAALMLGRRGTRLLVRARVVRRARSRELTFGA